jgi:hypothetical protein
MRFRQTAIASVLSVISIAGLNTAPSLIHAVAPDDSGAVASPETNPPTTESPVDPTTPVTTPASTPVTTPDSGGGGDDDTPWLAIIAIAVVVAGLIGFLVSRAAPSRSSSSAGAAPVGNSARTDVLGAAQWVNDQLALEVLAATPEQATQRWAVERSRVDSIAIRANQQAHGADASSWVLLGQILAAVGSSLDNAVTLRGQPEPNPALIQQAVDVVNGHRRQLAGQLGAMWPRETR